jgi:hypothetical protein
VSEFDRCRCQRRVAVFKVVFVIVAKVEGDRPVVDNGRVAESRSDRVDDTLERSNFVAGTGVAGQPAVVIADDADDSRQVMVAAVLRHFKFKAGPVAFGAWD